MANTTIYIFQADANGIRNGTRNTSSSDSTLKVFDSNTGIPSPTASDNSDIYIYYNLRYSENKLWFSDADTSKISGYNGKWIQIKYASDGKEDISLSRGTKDFIQNNRFAIQSCSTKDNPNLANIGDNYNTYSVTYAYFSQDTTATISCKFDGVGGVYLNNKLIFQSTYSNGTVNHSVTFSKGWNKIEIVQNEGNGGDCIQITDIKTVANCVGIDCSQVGTIPAKYSSYYIGDNILNFTKYNWK